MKDILGVAFTGVSIFIATLFGLGFVGGLLLRRLAPKKPSDTSSQAAPQDPSQIIINFAPGGTSGGGQKPITGFGGLGQSVQRPTNAN
jgi:hypothetical protein